MEAGNEYVDRWVCPNDRQLALRGRLETGWSTFAENVYRRQHGTSISDEEQDKILTILQQAQEIEEKEQERIGCLVEKVNNLKSSVIGDGSNTCLVCGVKKGPLKLCVICMRGVCPKCNMESSDAFGSKKVFCIICWEERELLKKSGAWFLKAMPVYITPEERIAKMKERMSVAGIEAIGTLSPRASLAPSVRQGSYYTEDADFTEDETTEESEDEISAKMDSVSTLYQDTVDGFNLGIDCGEVSAETQSSSVPKIQLVEETPADTTESKAHSFDWQESDGSLSPKMRQRARSNLSEGAKKIALKVRKRNKQDEKVASSVRSNEEDVDEIFKSYEEERGKNISNGKDDFCGPLGMIEFTLQYDSNTLELLVIIHCGKGFKAMDHGKTSDPYVKTHLLPGASKATKKRTQTVLKNLNPVFNETLVYHGITQKKISQKLLRLSVMDENRLSSNAFIGETCVPLKSLVNRPVQRFKRLLEEQSDEHIYENTGETDEIPGRIELALHYLSKQQMLVVGIIRCAELKAMDPNGYSDPYVKCYLIPDVKKKTKRKTAIKKKTLNPEFNEEFQYRISHSDLAKKSLCVTVWDHDVGTRNDFIGSVTLGIKSTGEALRHWFETLNTSDRRVTRWHTLSFFMPSGMDDDE